MSSRTDPCADRPLAVALAKHYEEIKAFILRKVGCAELAADVTQDAWVKMATATPGDLAPVQRLP
jgi:DNA-directed RNA polymerase specialized sigma24 family protein